MASTDHQRWARVPPHLAWKHPGLPREWTRVLERNPDAMHPEPLPGYVSLDSRRTFMIARESPLVACVRSLPRPVPRCTSCTTPVIEG